MLTHALLFGTKRLTLASGDKRIIIVTIDKYFLWAKYIICTISGYPDGVGTQIAQIRSHTSEW